MWYIGLDVCSIPGNGPEYAPFPSSQSKQEGIQFANICHLYSYIECTLKGENVIISGAFNIRRLNLSSSIRKYVSLAMAHFGNYHV